MAMQNSIKNLKTLGDFLDWASALFQHSEIYYGHGTDNPWDEAVMLAIAVLNLKPDVKASVAKRLLTAEEKQELIKLAKKRVKTCEPLAYLTNTAYFGNCKFYVDKRVIVPRSPFAELMLNKFKPYLQVEAKKIKNILEIGTGSACMSIVVAKQFPNVMVDALDISEDALQVAAINIARHKLKSRIKLFKSDVFDAIDSAKYKNKYDLIISNPPYASPRRAPKLPLEYSYEPVLALFAANNGFSIVEKIIFGAKQYLKPDGLLFVEVGKSWRKFATRYKELAFKWVKFNNGGEGVFMLKRGDLP